MSFIWDLSDVFLTLEVWERKVPDGKCPSYHITTRAQATNMTYCCEGDPADLAEVIFVRFLYCQVTFYTLLLRRTSLGAALT